MSVFSITLCHFACVSCVCDSVLFCVLLVLPLVCLVFFFSLGFLFCCQTFIASLLLLWTYVNFFFFFNLPASVCQLFHVWKLTKWSCFFFCFFCFFKICIVLTHLNSYTVSCRWHHVHVCIRCCIHGLLRCSHFFVLLTLVRSSTSNEDVGATWILKITWFAFYRSERKLDVH